MWACVRFQISLMWLPLIMVLFSLANTCYNTYCKPGTILSALQILTHYPHNSPVHWILLSPFVRQEAALSAAAWSRTASKWQSQSLKSDGLVWFPSPCSEPLCHPSDLGVSASQRIIPEQKSRNSVQGVLKPLKFLWKCCIYDFLKEGPWLSFVGQKSPQGRMA